MEISLGSKIKIEIEGEMVEGIITFVDFYYYVVGYQRNELFETVEIPFKNE